MTRVLIVALVVLANMALAPPLAGSAEQTGITAEIHEGNCDDIGEVVAPLVEARLPARDRRGNAAAMPAANSFTTVPISLEALTASDHAIVVPFPVRDEIVACGDIGGTLTEAGALMVGTSPQGKTKVSGIAYLSPGADPAARFAAVLAGRDSADCLAGPLAGSFVARGGQGAGVMMENFSVTVTFVNPMQQSETPWDYGFAFHRVGDTFQSIYVDSKGFWYYQGTRSGFVPTFDATSGATNTLDLVVEGNMARFGVNREFVGSIDLPPPTASDVYVGTGFFEGHDVEGREIRLRAVEVW